MKLKLWDGFTDPIAILAALMFMFSAAMVVDAVHAQQISPYSSMQISNTAIIMVSTAPTVTSASAQLLAANLTRRFFQIQNNDATGSVIVCFTATCTLTTGTKIGPGQSWTLYTPPNNVVSAIGSVASNANVIVVEGQ